MGERRDWDPIAELRGVQRRLNALFDSTLSRAEFDAPGDVDRWTPTCEAWVGEAAVVVCVELPGVARSEVDVRLEGDDLVVEGRREMAREAEEERYHRVERAYGRFTRRLRLPVTVDAEGVEARLERGVLRVTIPTRDAGARGPRQVAIG